MPLLLAVVLSGCGARLTPEQQEALLQRGDEELQAGRLREAETAFARVARAFPDNARAQFGLGLARIRQGRAADALTALDKAVDLEAGNPHYAYVRAHALASVGRKPEAVAALSTLVGSNPDHLQATAELIDLLVEDKKLAEAKQIAVDAAERAPRHFHVQMLAGRTLGLAGAPEPSRTYYERAQRLRPYAPEAAYGLVEALRAEGKIRESASMIRVFDELRAREADLEPLKQAAASNAADPAPAVRYIQELFREGRLDEAAEQTGLFLDQFPGRAEGGALAVRAAQASAFYGDRESTDRFVRAAMSLGKPSTDELFALGEAQSSVGQFMDAIEKYEMFLKQSPDDLRGLMGLGRAATRLQDLSRAEPPLRRAVSLAPGDARAHAALGLLLMKKNETSAARAEMDRALKLQPDQPDALFGLGFIAQQDHDAATAEKYLRRALAGQPDHASAQAVLAMLLAQEGRCEEAIPAFTRALEADFHNVQLHTGLVHCYEQAGRPGEAEQARRIAEEIFGSSQQSPQPSSQQ